MINSNTFPTAICTSKNQFTQQEQPFGKCEWKYKKNIASNNNQLHPYKTTQILSKCLDLRQRLFKTFNTFSLWNNNKIGTNRTTMRIAKMGLYCLKPFAWFAAQLREGLNKKISYFGLISYNCVHLLLFYAGVSLSGRCDLKSYHNLDIHFVDANSGLMDKERQWGCLEGTA